MCVFLSRVFLLLQWAARVVLQSKGRRLAVVTSKFRSLSVSDFSTSQISDVEGALVRTFLSPAHLRAASLVSVQTHN